MKQVPLAPIGSLEDPLNIAIKIGNQKLMMMLLAAGAPILANPLRKKTILELVHETPSLPTLFTAVIRKVIFFILYLKGLCNQNSPKSLPNWVSC